MEERRLNFDAPLLSVRRISTKPEFSSESDEKNKNSTKVLSSRPNTERSVPVDGSFDHLTEPATVPFVWEQIPGRPRDVIGSEIPKEGLIEKANLENEREQEGRDDDDDDDDGDEEVYSDAVDMASLNESLSVNCSVSGVSGFEKNLSFVEDSGKFCEDVPEYRDLMMSRFLEAAKAMALKQQQQNQISSSMKKKPTRINKEVVVPERRDLIKITKHEPIAIPRYSEDLNEEDEETDDDDDDCGFGDGIYSNVAKKGWGFLPRLCIKNSLNVLSQVPALRIKTCHNLGKPGKVLHPKPRDSVYRQNLGCRSQSSPRICGSNRVVNDSGDQQLLTPTWSSRRLSGFISPYRYASNRSPFSESGFLGTPDKAEIFRVNRLNKGISKSQELYPRRTREIPSLFNSPLAEKRASVDSVNYAETRMQRNSISRTQTRIGRTVTDQKREFLTRSCSIQDVKFLAEEVKTRKNRSGNLLETSTLGQRSPVAVTPPPLPKTPSESWLWRKLPSVTPRNSISNPYVTARVNSKKMQQETPESMKWETIVKTSYIHHDHVRYSEVLSRNTSVDRLHSS